MSDPHHRHRHVYKHKLIQNTYLRSWKGSALTCDVSTEWLNTTPSFPRERVRVDERKERKQTSLVWNSTILHHLFLLRPVADTSNAWHIAQISHVSYECPMSWVVHGKSKNVEVGFASSLKLEVSVHVLNIQPFRNNNKVVSFTLAIYFADSKLLQMNIIVYRKA